MNLRILLIFLFVFSVESFSFAQTVIKQVDRNLKPPVSKPVSFQFVLMKEKEDKKGTDVRNIYNITVESKDGSSKAGQPYRVLFFVDDRLEENFGKKPLPFSFKKNFKGFKTGGHTLQIKLEDDNDNVVMSENVVLDVIH